MSASWQRAAEIAPVSVYKGEDWKEYWDQNPEVLLELLGEIYKVYKHEEAKRAGTAPRAGRRKRSIDGNIDELFSILTPQLSTEPFPEAFRRIQGERSLRQIAMRCGYQHRTISRWLESYPKTKSGAINVEALEAVAKALKVHPAYFAEWRYAVIQEMLEQVFFANPNLSISFLKRLTVRR